MLRGGPPFRSERPARAWQALLGLAAWALLTAAPGAAWAVLNEAENPASAPNSPLFPAASQRVPVSSLDAVPFDAGWLFLDLNTTVTGAVPGPSDVQGWVDVLHDPSGRHSVLQRPAHLSVAGP